MSKSIILVPVDFSLVTADVVHRAIRLAVGFDDQIELLHVEETEFGEVVRRDNRLPAGRAEKAGEKLRALCDEIRDEGVDVYATMLRGDAAKLILEEAQNRRVDSIVIGSHGHSAHYQNALGRVSEQVVKKARCPVMVVPSVSSDAHVPTNPYRKKQAAAVGYVGR